MNKLKISLTLLVCFSITILYAQNTEESSIKKTINQLFDGMRKSDSTLVRNAFNQGAILQTIANTKEGRTVVRSSDVNAFIASIAKPHPEIYDERITFTKILIDDNLASVWTDYKFYIGKRFSHCGVNSFQLVKTENGWKTVYLIDTRRKENCN
ncbi:nuclear transport factor 2 family protein [Pedobacter xixiisoli]|uniref:Lumazine-binding n=1 Tax=Pedobacter xixiisoli TaxID=1476464 RepID=A0A286AED3_9SPHI|nr:nuclear transport factor 2 family protein [Pedobacter xixiisoli]SOD20256.1 Putative lumazine-binding [Pedobacter xixiisoli]